MGHDNWTSHDQQCCLVESGRRCGRVAGNASYSKRIQKTVAQRKLKLHMDNSVSFNPYLCGPLPKACDLKGLQPNKHFRRN